MSHFINTVWNEDFHFVSTIDQKQVHFDATAISKDYNKGVSPKTILLSGLSGCTGMDVVSILNHKFKVAFSDFSIDVKGELTETHPKVYHQIHITYRIKVNKEFETKVKEAVDLSLNKYCGVSAMLGKTATITYEIQFL
jgi:putative redox protein